MIQVKKNLKCTKFFFFFLCSKAQKTYLKMGVFPCSSRNPVKMKFVSCSTLYPITPQIDRTKASTSLVITKKTKKKVSLIGGNRFQTKMERNRTIIISFRRNRAQNPVQTLGTKKNAMAEPTEMGPKIQRWSNTVFKIQMYRIHWNCIWENNLFRMVRYWVVSPQNS